MFVIPSTAPVIPLENHKFSVEASSLGLSPGQIPESVEFNGTEFGLQAYNAQEFVYMSADNYQFVILND